MNHIMGSKQNVFKRIIIISVILVICVWAVSGVGFTGLKDSAWEITKAVFKGVIHPDWSYVWDGGGEDLVSLMIETVCIAFLGTFISTILCLPFAFLAANNMWRFKYMSTFGKVILTICRTFPEIVLAIIFIKMVGPGSFAGVLAVGLHSIGMMGKLYAETIETLDEGPVEAITSVGGNGWNALFFAKLPQLMPNFLSYAIYRFEISVRSASILGIVGAGGIGTPLIFSTAARAWDRVGIILLGIIVTVTIIDLISSYLRKKLV